MTFVAVPVRIGYVTSVCFSGDEASLLSCWRISATTTCCEGFAQIESSPCSVSLSTWIPGSSELSEESIDSNRLRSAGVTG